MTGDTANFFEMPVGTQISDYSENTSLTIRPQITTKNEPGSYDVSDVFAEVSVPLLVDAPGARELTLDFAARQSDYSTIGRTTTWKTNLIWAPVDSFAVRGTYSEAVRAPNITELFGPEIGAGFRPNDPCAVQQLDALAQADPALAAQTQANCVIVLNGIGVDPFNYDPNAVPGEYSFFDPLSGFFGGVTSGNRLLQEETAETLTVGFVFQPEFIPGFSLTVDFWDISIDDAIQAVSAQAIVNGCYQGAVLNPNFRQLSERNDDPGSAQFGGFKFLRQSTINFVKIETSGIDFAARYQFEVGAHGFDVTVQGTSVDEINNFDNPLDVTNVNPELREINRPELAGNVFLNWTYGDMRVGLQSQFMDEMLFGGVKNLTDEKPFVAENAFPSSPRGTFYFFGVEYSM